MRSDERRSIPAKLLIALGIAAQLAAALALMAVDPVLEYAVPAPEVRQVEAALALMAVDPVLEYAVPAPEVRQVEAGDGRAARAETGIEARIEARDDVEAQLADAVSAFSAEGTRAGESVSFNGKTAIATLRAVDLRWLETCPRQLRSGRWMDGAELTRGAKVAVLDEDLAFELFGSDPAEGGEVELAGEKYRVIGTARHRRGVGETDPYALYVPLRAAARQGIQLDVLTLRALSAAPSGLAQSFAEAAGAAWGAGELHDLRKERMGALLLTRLLLCAFGLGLMFRLGRWLSRLIVRWRAQIAARRSHEYVRRWLAPALLRALGALLLAVALLAAVYGLLSLGIAPVYSFTEWVPESLVSVSALQKVFWSRTADAARLIALNTPESARIAFWGALDRAGAVLLLLGLALGKNKRIAAKIGNQSTDATV